jgi:hypothetical protein
MHGATTYDETSPQRSHSGGWCVRMQAGWLALNIPSVTLTAVAYSPMLSAHRHRFEIPL